MFTAGKTARFAVIKHYLRLSVAVENVTEKLENAST
jgi:hypothetical protein